MDSVVILGAGLAGLGCARDIPGSRIFEANDHPGGHAYSHPVDGVHFDQGAHISHTKDADFAAMIGAAAGVVSEITPSIVRNYWGGRWLTYPVQNHLHELPLDHRVPALTELVNAHVQKDAADPVDYLQWCRAQYGNHLTEHFYKKFTAKYWRTPMTDLATDWLGGRLIPSQLPRIVAGAFGPHEEKGAVFAKFRYPSKGGFFGFFSSLYDGLDIEYRQRATEVDTLRRVVSFQSGRQESYEFLASSIPLPDLVAITKDIPQELRDEAQKLRHTQLLCVNLIVDRPKLTDNHWFYIYDDDIEAARVSIPSNLAPGSVPKHQTAIQAEVFRRDDESFDIGNLVERTIQQMSSILRFNAVSDVRTKHHVLVRRAYVISNHERANAVQAILDWLESRDIFSMGLYGRWKYIWSDEAFRQGRQAAHNIRSRSCTAK